MKLVPYEDIDGRFKLEFCLTREEEKHLKASGHSLEEFGRLAKKKLERMIFLLGRNTCNVCGKQFWITESVIGRKMILSGKSARKTSDYCQGKCD